MSFYQLGNKALKVSMKLFALNRSNLVQRIRSSEPDLANKLPVIILKGGEAEYRHCTDHEILFRQVILSIILI